jgi:hypothetical protein
LSIDGASLHAETNSKQELRASMESYFAGCGACQAKLSQLFASGTRVSALELAVSSGQQSLSVYEFSGDLIRRVYYFPAEPQP